MLIERQAVMVIVFVVSTNTTRFFSLLRLGSLFLARRGTPLRLRCLRSLRHAHSSLAFLPQVVPRGSGGNHAYRFSAGCRDSARGMRGQSTDIHRGRATGPCDHLHTGLDWRHRGCGGECVDFMGPMLPEGRRALWCPRVRHRPASRRRWRLWTRVSRRRICVHDKQPHDDRKV
jgi:hypothetical protein